MDDCILWTGTVHDITDPANVIVRKHGRQCRLCANLSHAESKRRRRAVPAPETGENDHGE